MRADVEELVRAELAKQRAEALPSVERLAQALDVAGVWYDPETQESICHGTLDDIAAATLAALRDNTH